jgi:hypothetical protein
MEREHRKRSNDNPPENVERPARGRQRRTRDSGALPDVTPTRKNRLDETPRRNTGRRRLPHHG